MATRRRPSTALIDDPEMPGESDLDRDLTPARRGPGRPRKTTGAAAAEPARRPGRKPGTVRIAARDSGGKIMSKQEMKATVAGELGMLLTLGVGAMELRDPAMGEVFTTPISMGGLGDIDPIDGIVDRTVNLLARNEKYLAYAAKGGVLTDVLGLAFIVGTLAQRMYQVSAYRRSEQRGEVDGDQFPAYAGVAAG